MPLGAAVQLVLVSLTCPHLVAKNLRVGSSARTITLATVTLLSIYSPRIVFAVLATFPDCIDKLLQYRNQIYKGVQILSQKNPEELHDAAPCKKATMMIALKYK